MAACDAASSESRKSQKLDLSFLPPIYILPTHIEDGVRNELEDKLLESGAPLTYDILEARIVIGNVGTKRRAELEMRVRKLWTDSVEPSRGSQEEGQPPSKRLRVSTEPSTAVQQHTVTADAMGLKAGHVYVVNQNWLDQVLEGKRPRLKDSLVYEGKVVEKTTARGVTSDAVSHAGSAFLEATSPQLPLDLTDPTTTADSIIQRAEADAQVLSTRAPHSRYAPSYGYGPRKLGQRHSGHSHSPKKVGLMQQTTSDYEGSSNDELPDPPDWVKKGIRYACERITPADSPNGEFIEQLKKIRLARTLTDDEIGVRAYSTSIAAIAAYPYAITRAREILQLPGCDVKIANLWVEWKNTGGRIAIVEEAEEDDTMKVLRDFYQIWGVGATSAREFFFDRGWRDRDDIVEYGWQTLSRVQQIGVKYYDELLEGIPRAEVERIAMTVKEHAIRVRDTGIELLVVGGYRRGKESSGDVDMIVSHRNTDKTANLVTDIVASLEAAEWITHTLLLSLNGTQRGQSTLPFRGRGHGGHGFDTLDKALVVWQDPNWPGKGVDKKQKNPNPHRRVDIIISPWRTVGCAVTGWSGGTTFQRDLRRLAKNRKGWKFDSSGVRSRTTGLVIDLEGPDGVEGDMIDAEKAVFRGMGLTYVEPWHRCTH